MQSFSNLTHHGYDVFLDFNGIASGDFERVILENIHARAHFLVILTPSALERCSEPGDWLRREIETALDARRNIVPLMLESFDFGALLSIVNSPAPSPRSSTTTRSTFPQTILTRPWIGYAAGILNVSLDSVLHPVSPSSGQAAKNGADAAALPHRSQRNELTAEEWFERGFNS